MKITKNMSKQIYDVTYFSGTRYTAYVEAHSPEEAEAIAEALSDGRLVTAWGAEEVDSEIDVYEKPISPDREDYGEYRKIADENNDWIDELYDLEYEFKGYYITINQSDDGYDFNVWPSKEAYKDDSVDPLDGGTCTSDDFSDALDMAYECAQDLINKK